MHSGYGIYVVGELGGDEEVVGVEDLGVFGLGLDLLGYRAAQRLRKGAQDQGDGEVPDKDAPVFDAIGTPPLVKRPLGVDAQPPILEGQSDDARKVGRQIIRGLVVVAKELLQKEFDGDRLRLGLPREGRRAKSQHRDEESYRKTHFTREHGVIIPAAVAAG